LPAATRQIATIVVGSLLTAYGLSALVWLSFDMRPGPPPEFIGPASQIGLTLRLLETLPTEDREKILAALSTRGFAVREGIGLPPVLHAQDSPQARGLKHALREELHLEDELLPVGFETRSNGDRGSLDILIARGFPPDHWLLFQLPRDDDRHGIPLRWVSPSGVASFIAVPLLVGFISLWAARRVTSPLVRLAAATEGLGTLRDPAAVAEEGALEVRQVARAFNLVSESLRLFIADRTRMLASISHDLRTPLTRLRLRVEIMHDFETRKKMLNDIRTMESMISSTLAFIRDEAALEPIERVDMGVLLQTICDEFNDAGNQVTMKVPFIAGHPVAHRRFSARS
jgi:hypothetical protein